VASAVVAVAGVAVLGVPEVMVAVAGVAVLGVPGVMVAGVVVAGEGGSSIGGSRTCGPRRGDSLTGVRLRASSHGRRVLRRRGQGIYIGLPRRRAH